MARNKIAKEYFDATEQAETFGEAFVAAFAAYKAKRAELLKPVMAALEPDMAALVAMATPKLPEAGITVPAGKVVTLTPGFGDTIGVGFVDATKAGPKGKLSAREKLAKLGAVVSAPVTPIAPMPQPVLVKAGQTLGEAEESAKQETKGRGKRI